MEEEKIINGNCWVACCDILGFKNKVKRFELQYGVGHLNVFVENYFKRITDELGWQTAHSSNDIFYTWFSDTFLFFTRNDSKNAFSLVHNRFDGFCCGIISAGWPLRAAIGFGQLYADVSKNLFLGSGIINAYEYAEKQNWIGSIVTPEADNRLNELGVDLSLWKGAFTKYPVPFHQQKERGKTFESELFVSRINQYDLDIKKAIEMMQQEAMRDKNYETKYKVKYDNTLKFIK
ncbi:MAG: hypothetical protein ABSB25_02845 [Sedimentisphaerales bacterium]|jgi:hypothetical protein